MRATAISAIATALVISGAAWAQGTQQQQPQAGAQQQTTAGAQQQMTTGGQQGGGQAMEASRQQVREALRQAGFQNIEVLDAAYLVQAQTQQGETVMMIVNPAQGTASVIQRSGTTGATGGGAAGGGAAGGGATGQTQPGQQPAQSQ